MANTNYYKILSPISLTIGTPAGREHNVQINHKLSKNADGNYVITGIFNLFVDNFGMDKDEFDDLDFDETAEMLDEQHPDYLGRILFDSQGDWVYEGEALSVIEQEQIGEFISNYEEGDIDY